MDTKKNEEPFQQPSRIYYRRGMVMGLIAGILFGLGIGFMIGYHLGSGGVIIIPLDQGIET